MNAATIRRRLPQLVQRSTSLPKTRRSSSAQGRRVGRCSGDTEAKPHRGLRLAASAGTMTDRSADAGARTSAKVSRSARGGGTSIASRNSSARGCSTTAIGPSHHRCRSSYSRRRSVRSCSRSVASAGRATETAPPLCGARVASYHGAMDAVAPAEHPQDALALGRVQVLVDEQCAGPFGELSPWQLRATWADDPGSWMCFVRGGGRTPHLTVDPWFAHAPEPALRGVIAHELGHAEIARRRGLLQHDLEKRLLAVAPDWALLRRLLPGLVGERVHRTGQQLLDWRDSNTVPANGQASMARAMLRLAAGRAGWMLVRLEEQAATRIAIERGFGHDILAAGDFLEAAGFEARPLWAAPRRRIEQLVEYSSACRSP